MQFDWWTVALQGINFLVLAWLLQHFLYKPVKGVIEQRRQLTERAFEQARQAEAAAEAERAGLAEDREKLADEREEVLRRLHKDAEEERAKARAAAEAEARRLVEQAQAEIEGSRKETLAEMRGEIAGLAADLAATLLRRSAAAMPPGVYLRQMEQEFAKLPEEERRRLESDLAEPNARLTVITALPLPADDRKEWSDWLQSRIGTPHSTEFADDESIIGGVELRFPHTVLRFTWADQLAKARDALMNGSADA